MQVPYTLHEAILSGKQLMLSSDAAIDAAKYSCYAWAIYSTTPLSEGEGIIPGHLDDLFSEQLEASGILIAILFLHHYAFFLLWQLFQLQITVYCDNESIIKHINKKLWNPIIFPSATTENAFNVFHEIMQAIR